LAAVTLNLVDKAGAHGTLPGDPEFQTIKQLTLYTGVLSNIVVDYSRVFCHRVTCGTDAEADFRLTRFHATSAKMGRTKLCFIAVALSQTVEEEERQRAHGPYHQPAETKLPRQTCNKNLDVSTHEVLPRYAGLKNRHSSGDGSHTRHYHIYTLHLLRHLRRLLWETASPQVLLQGF